jgi:hypothetical protein
MDNVRTHHLSDDDIVRYRGRQLPPPELLAADGHLARCESCHQRLTEWAALSAKVRSAVKAFDDAATGPFTHLTYEQLAALVEDQVSEIDREILTSHLDLCQPCQTELNDLRELHLSLATREKDRKTPVSGRPSFFWQGLLPLPRIPAYGLLAVAMIAVVALASFLLSLPLRRENAKARERIAELEQSYARLKEQGTAVGSLQNELAELRKENDRLRTVAEAQALVTLNDAGGRIVLDAQGHLSGMQTSNGYDQLITEALRTERVKLSPSLREIRSQSGTLMGSGQAEFSVTSPVGIVIETDRPTFRWTPVDGGESYTVTVYDSNVAKVAESELLTSTEWALPSNLARGRIYIWQVRATRDGRQMIAPSPAAGRAKFKVLEQSRVEQIASAKRSGFKSHLVMGLLYAEAGLLNEAERELEALQKANPDSAIARKLLRDVTQAKR